MAGRRRRACRGAVRLHGDHSSSRVRWSTGQSAPPYPRRTANGTGTDDRPRSEPLVSAARVRVCQPVERRGDCEPGACPRRTCGHALDGCRIRRDVRSDAAPRARPDDAGLLFGLTLSPPGPSLGLQALGLTTWAALPSVLAAFLGIAVFAVGSGLTTLARPYLVQAVFGGHETGFLNGRLVQGQQLARVAHRRVTLEGVRPQRNRSVFWSSAAKSDFAATQRKF